MLKQDQQGFSLTDVIILVVVVGALGFVGTRVATNVQQGKKAVPSAPSQKEDEPTKWVFDEARSRWVSTGKAPPACPRPLFDRSPVDTRLASSVLYPGQYRGGDYKSDGGLRFDNQPSGDIQVVLPMDTELVQLVRYLENGEVQYLLTFTNPCGITLRFDRLHTLTPPLMEIAQTTPEPKPDASRGSPLAKPVAFRAGDAIATAVGFKDTENVSFDFGVYDLRSLNEIAKNSTWAELHETGKSTEWFGRCWLDLLPAADRDRLRELPPGDQASKNISDYCSTVLGTTLEHNDGRPE